MVIAGGREPPQWEAYPHHQYISTSGMLDCCQTGGCWKSRCQPVGDGDAKDRDLCAHPIEVGRDLRIPKCMDMISPGDVIQRIEMYYQAGTLHYNDRLPSDRFAADESALKEGTMTERERLEELYEDHILRHAEAPYHKGRLPHPTVAGVVRNPLCGDEIRLELLIDDAGRIEQAYFDGRGCVISRAAASILCEYIEGKDMTTASKLFPSAMFDLLRVPLSPARRRCGLLPREALQQLLAKI